ncbi:hypothetical protein B0T24DRAFT_341566 [Lasiosphaeria ovina]|uniref:FAD-binding domain-containing protein n=1 Tax=Lasiosphaeria ovina TaxID=92902 RepID=A0AAE0K2J2_9PEZI|nr:hypothetical protein B0T24DRAFT_341566 [Lasiosphaeria ovina]
MSDSWRKTRSPSGMPSRRGTTCWGSKNSSTRLRRASSTSRRQTISQLEPRVAGRTAPLAVSATRSPLKPPADIPGHQNPRPLPLRCAPHANPKNYTGPLLRPQLLLRQKLLSFNYPTPSTVRANFSDGTTSTGSVVIGCDGGSSQVRKCLLGEDLAAQEVLPYAFMNFPFSLPADKAVWLDEQMNPSVDVAPHPKSMYMGLFLLDKPDFERPEMWVFYVLVTWPIADKEDEENAPNRLERLRAKMEGWADPYKSVVEWLSEDISIGADQLRIWHPRKWDNREGRVTLAGDAAYSMTFHRGQAGNLAIKDADEFVKAMVEVKERRMSLKEAMDVHDRGVVERGEVEISRLQAAAFHDYENFDNSPVFKMGSSRRGNKALGGEGWRCWKTDMEAYQSTVSVGTR